MISDSSISFSMQILASYNWIKEYLDTNLSPEEFATLTTDVGNSVEVMDRVADRFDQMVVGDVLQVEPHPHADKLHIVLTDIGKKKVEIVCGGANLAVGQKVVVGLPGAKVRWHGEGELVELKETEIRGVTSHGMICAVEEIGFEKLKQHDGDIWDITALTNTKAGTSVSEALDLDDVLFDIEVTSNRPDCKSIIGQAREGAAATETMFTWVPGVPEGVSGDAGFSVEVKDSDLCPRYTAVVIDGITVGPSPWWLQKKLLLSGFKPINNLVDITNFVLHEYGQPLHTFDADKLEGQKIVVRKAKKGEQFVALDEQAYELSSDMLVVADGERPVAVAGVMGGLATGTTESTTKVVIECAAFEPVSVRRTARTLNLYSDSQLLFEKGLSTEALGPALARAIELIKELAGGEVVSKIFDERRGVYEPLRFPYDAAAVNRLLGIQIEEKDQVAILHRLGFDVKGGQAVVPYWRDHDIEESVDLVEEIARVYGYNNFPSRLPSGELPRATEHPGLVWQRRVKEFLAGIGFSEAYSYSFVSKDQLEHYGINEETAVKVRNPLSVEHEYLRTSLVPSLMTTVEENQARVTSADIFELAPIYTAKKHDIPDQEFRLVMGTYGKDGAALFVRLKGALEQLFKHVGIRDWSLARGTDGSRWHLGRSARILVNGQEVGVIGQVSRSVEQAFGVDVATVVIDLDFESLIPQLTKAKVFIPVPQFPAVKRDLAFLVDERIEYGMIEEKILGASHLVQCVELFDVYRGKGIGEQQKSLGVHLDFRSDEKTLEAEEVDEQLSTIRKMLEKEFDAILRS